MMPAIGLKICIQWRIPHASFKHSTTHNRQAGSNSSRRLWHTLLPNSHLPLLATCMSNPSPPPPPPPSCTCPRICMRTRLARYLSRNLPSFLRHLLQWPFKRVRKEGNKKDRNSKPNFFLFIYCLVGSSAPWMHTRRVSVLAYDRSRGVHCRCRHGQIHWHEAGMSWLIFYWFICWVFGPIDCTRGLFRSLRSRDMISEGPRSAAACEHR